MKAMIVKLSELGMNCWLPQRFIDGTRCCRVFDCTYPDREECKAVGTEIAYCFKQLKAIISELFGKIADLRTGRARKKGE